MPQDKSIDRMPTPGAATSADLPNPGAAREIAEAARANGGAARRPVEEEPNGEEATPPGREIKEAGRA